MTNPADATDFIERESESLELIHAKGLTLPQRLADWPLWIDEYETYLTELKAFAES